MNKADELKSRNLRGQLDRLVMSALDFRHALSAATFLLEEVDWSRVYRIEEQRRFKCYETTMVVAYARPFTQARGRSAPFSWKLVQPGLALTGAEKALHEKLYRLRNELHAHSDDSASLITSEIWRTRLPEGGTFDFLSIAGGEELVFTFDEVQAIHNFLWKVRHHVDNAVQTHPAPRDHLPVVVRDLWG